MQHVVSKISVIIVIIANAEFSILFETTVRPEEAHSAVSKGIDTLRDALRAPQGER